MNTPRTIIAVVAVAVSFGCAPTEKVVGTTTPMVPWAKCSAEPYNGPIAATKAPKEWTPEPGFRGYLHLHFIADGERVFAIGVPVGEGSMPLTPFVVGPMTGEIQPFPPYSEKAHKLLQQNTNGWYEFYKALFHAYSESRPMGLVCPDGQGCRSTPEVPPPYLLGTTGTYSAGGISALEKDPGVRYAENQPAPAGTQPIPAEMAQTGVTVTDALMSAPTTDPNDPRAVKRRALVSAVVIRAVCASRVLTVPPR